MWAWLPLLMVSWSPPQPETSPAPLPSPMAHLHHICDLLTCGWNKLVMAKTKWPIFLFSLPFSSISQLVMPPQLVWVGLGGPRIACVTWSYNLCPFEEHTWDIFALLRHRSTRSAKAATSTDTITFQRSLAELDFTFLMCKSLAMPLLISFSMAVMLLCLPGRQTGPSKSRRNVRVASVIHLYPTTGCHPELAVPDICCRMELLTSQSHLHSLFHFVCPGPSWL